jgi:molecular chaperone Hsp33
VAREPGLILPAETGFLDTIQPFQIERAGVRGRLVRLGPSFDAALGGHGYAPAVMALLAETVALTAALAAGLKFEGVFTLQARGDGPLGTLMSDITDAGVYRAFAQADDDRLAAVDPAEADARPVPVLLGGGHIAFTVDQGPDTDRYQGITALEGATLADCLHGYFRQSEQIETAVIVHRAGRAGGGDAASAAAAVLLLQKMPEDDPLAAAAGADADAWRRSATLAASVRADELLDGALAPETLLYRLFHEDGVRVFEPRALVHGCRCGEDRVLRTLRSFPASEIMALADDDGRVRVTCEFCKTTYAFDPAAVLEANAATATDTLQ